MTKYTTAQLVDGFITSLIDGNYSKAKRFFNEAKRRANRNWRQKTIRTVEMLENIIQNISHRTVVPLGNYNRYTHYQLTEVFCVALILEDLHLAQQVQEIFIKRASNGRLGSERRAYRMNQLLNYAV